MTGFRPDDDNRRLQAGGQACRSHRRRGQGRNGLVLDEMAGGAHGDGPGPKVTDTPNVLLQVTDEVTTRRYAVRIDPDEQALPALNPARPLPQAPGPSAPAAREPHHGGLGGDAGLHPGPGVRLHRRGRANRADSRRPAIPRGTPAGDGGGATGRARVGFRFAGPGRRRSDRPYQRELRQKLDRLQPPQVGRPRRRVLGLRRSVPGGSPRGAKLASTPPRADWRCWKRWRGASGRPTSRATPGS